MYPISVTEFHLLYSTRLNVNIRITTRARTRQCIYSNEFRLLLSVSLVLDLVFSTLSVAISATLVGLLFCGRASAWQVLAYSNLVLS
jgi:hypothetical protein